MEADAGSDTKERESEWSLAVLLASYASLEARMMLEAQDLTCVTSGYTENMVVACLEIIERFTCLVIAMTPYEEDSSSAAENVDADTVSVTMRDTSYVVTSRNRGVEERKMELKKASAIAKAVNEAVRGVLVFLDHVLSDDGSINNKNNNHDHNNNTNHNASPTIHRKNTNASSKSNAGDKNSSSGGADDTEPSLDTSSDAIAAYNILVYAGVKCVGSWLQDEYSMYQDEFRTIVVRVLKFVVSKLPLVQNSSNNIINAAGIYTDINGESLIEYMMQGLVNATMDKKTRLILLLDESKSLATIVTSKLTSELWAPVLNGNLENLTNAMPTITTLLNLVVLDSSLFSHPKSWGKELARSMYFGTPDVGNENRVGAYFPRLVQSYIPISREGSPDVSKTRENLEDVKILLHILFAPSFFPLNQVVKVVLRLHHHWCRMMTVVKKSIYITCRPSRHVRGYFWQPCPRTTRS